MIVDTSALIAILLSEPDSEILSAAIASTTPRIISAVTALEASIVIENKKGEAGLALLDELLSLAQFEIVAFNDAQQRIARVAYRRYGKGRHPAGLNLETAALMRLPRRATILCYSRATTSIRRTSRPRHSFRLIRHSVGAGWMY